MLVVFTDGKNATTIAWKGVMVSKIIIKHGKKDVASRTDLIHDDHCIFRVCLDCKAI